MGRVAPGDGVFGHDADARWSAVQPFVAKVRGHDDLLDIRPWAGGRFVSNDGCRQDGRGEAQRHPQDDSAATYTTKLTKADGHIDWAQPATQIINRIRGLQPWPGATTIWKGKGLKLLRARSVIGCSVAAPGTIMQITDEGFVVSVSEGGVLITEVQLEAKRPMPAADFCRGRRLQPGTTLGS